MLNLQPTLHSTPSLIWLIMNMLQYILVKILEPRQDTAGKVGIVGIKFYGFVRKPVLVEETVIVSHTIVRTEIQ